MFVSKRGIFIDGASSPIVVSDPLVEDQFISGLTFPAEAAGTKTFGGTAACRTDSTITLLKSVELGGSIAAKSSIVFTLFYLPPINLVGSATVTGSISATLDYNFSPAFGRPVSVTYTKVAVGGSTYPQGYGTPANGSAQVYPIMPIGNKSRFDSVYYTCGGSPAGYRSISKDWPTDPSSWAYGTYTGPYASITFTTSSSPAYSDTYTRLAQCIALDDSSHYSFALASATDYVLRWNHTGGSWASTGLVAPRTYEEGFCFATTNSACWYFMPTTATQAGKTNYTFAYSKWNGSTWTALSTLTFHSVKDHRVHDLCFVHGPSGSNIVYVIYRLTVVGAPTVYYGKVRTFNTSTNVLSSTDMASVTLTRGPDSWGGPPTTPSWIPPYHTYYSKNVGGTVYNYLCFLFQGEDFMRIRFTDAAPTASSETIQEIWQPYYSTPHPNRTVWSIEIDPGTGEYYMVRWCMPTGYPTTVEIDYSYKNIFSPINSPTSYVPPGGMIQGLPGAPSGGWFTACRRVQAVIAPQAGRTGPPTVFMFEAQDITNNYGYEYEIGVRFFVGTATVLVSTGVGCISTTLATLTNFIPPSMYANPVCVVTTTAALTTEIKLVGALLCEAPLINVPFSTTPKWFEAEIAALTTVSPAPLITGISLSASVQSVASKVNATLTTQIKLASSVACVTSASVTGLDTIQVIIFEQHWFQMGTTWMTDFLTLCNNERAAIGLPPYKNFATDALSLKKYEVADIAQHHSADMAYALIFAHDDNAFPSGWQTSSQRLGYMGDRGGENIAEIYCAWLYTYPVTYNFPTAQDAFDTWWASPPHKANILMDYGVDGDHTYSSIGFDVSFFDTASAAAGGYVSTNWAFVYFTNNFMVLEEVYLETTFAQYWANTGAVIALLEQVWSNDSYVNVRTSHEADYPLILGVTHEADWGVSVQASHESPMYYGVQADHESPYESADPITAGFHEAPYDIHQVVVQQSHEASCTLYLAVSHETPYEAYQQVATVNEAQYEEYGMVKAINEAQYEGLGSIKAINEAQYEPQPFVSFSHEAQYGEYGDVVAAHEAQYEQLSKVRISNEAVYQAMSSMMASNEAPYVGTVSLVQIHEAPIVTPNPVAQSNEQGYDLTVNNPLSAVHEGHYTLINETLAAGANEVLLGHNNVVIRLKDGFVSSGKGDVGYRFEGAIEDLSVFATISELDPITVDFCGEQYSLIVDSKSVERTKVGSTRCTITAVSPIQYLDLPFSGGRDYTPTIAMNARAMVEEVLGAVVSWSIADWEIPAYRVQIIDASPLAIAKQIVQTAGAVVSSEPDGSVSIQYVYPYNWDTMSEGSPDQVYSDVQHNLSSNSNFEYRSGYNRFRLRDSDSSYGDRIEWVVDEVDPMTGIAKVFPSPYRDSWELRTTTELGVQVAALGQVVRSYTELVEFRGGRASMANPVISLDSVVWKSASLGSISFDPYSLDIMAPLTVNFGYGLAEITYTSKAYEFQVTASAPVDATQLIVQEN